METVEREFLQALERDLSATTDVIFALRLAADDDASAELMNQSGELLGRLVAFGCASTTGKLRTDK